jgi:hypothetical protein
MSTELREIPSKLPVSAEGRTAAPVTKPALREIVAAVLTDSQVKPGEYLDEVVVPKGGE